MTVSTVDERLLTVALTLSVESADDRVEEFIRRRAVRLVSLLSSVAFFVALYDVAMLSGIQSGWRV